MPKRTKAQKCKDLFDAFKCVQEGRTVKRSGAKDGSITTKPTVIVREALEAEVLKDCMDWLHLHGITADRHDVGTFQNNRGQWGTYGIKGAGDIIGILKTGQHFELEIKKSNGGRLSIGQQKRMEKVRDSNGLYFVVHGVEELQEYFYWTKRLT